MLLSPSIRPVLSNSLRQSTAAKATPLEPFCNYQNPKPELEDVEMIGPDEISWIAPMYGSSGWSSRLAHGADVLFPISEIAIRLSKKLSEQTVVLDTVRFLSPIQADRISIRVRRNSRPDTNKPNIVGRFKSERWEIFHFTAKEDWLGKIRTRREHNLTARTLVNGEIIEIHQGEQYLFRPEIPHADILLWVARSSAFGIASVADILNILWVHINGDRDSELHRAPSHVALVVENQWLPVWTDWLQAFARGMTIPIKLSHESRPLASGLRVVSLSMFLPGQNNPAVVKVAYSCDPDTCATIKRRLQVA